MKYEIDGLLLRETIRNYVIKGDKILVYFLDNNKPLILDNSLELQTKLDSLMLAQIKKYTKRMGTEEEINVARESLVPLTSFTAVTSLVMNAVSGVFLGKTIEKVVAGMNMSSLYYPLFLEGVTLTVTALGAYALRKKYLRLDDQRKNKYYLEEYETLADPKSIELVNSVSKKKISDIAITPNNIDNYSLNDLQRIKEILEKLKLINESTTDEISVESSKSLVKKRN